MERCAAAYLSNPQQPKPKGCRSVAFMTPSQIARKRAKDREAQRLIRARTKEYIERLEREVQALKSQQPNNKIVVELMRHNMAMEEELANLRNCRDFPLSTYANPLPVMYGECAIVRENTGPKYSVDGTGLGGYIDEGIWSPSSVQILGPPNNIQVTSVWEVIPRVPSESILP